MVHLAISALPGETTHGTALTRAKASLFSASPVPRIWCGLGALPHGMRRFKRWNEPRSADTLRDIGGLCSDTTGAGRGPAREHDARDWPVSTDPSPQTLHRSGRAPTPVHALIVRSFAVAD